MLNMMPQRSTGIWNQIAQMEGILLIHGCWMKAALIQVSFYYMIIYHLLILKTSNLSIASENEADLKVENFRTADR
jgi:hypothetical protein